jgi:Mg-chelatase subunit ChlD
MEKLDVIATRNEAGGTPTGIAIKTEVSFMRKKIPDLRNKVPMIVITDGAPNNQTYARDVCKQMKKYIKLYGIGISCYEKDMKDMFGENYIAINNASELSRKLIQLSKRIVRNS